MIGAVEPVAGRPARSLAPPESPPAPVKALPAPAPVPVAAAPAPTPPAAVEVKPDAPVDTSDLTALWGKVARQASGSNALLRTALISSRLVRVEGDSAVIASPARFAAAAGRGQTAIGHALAAALGRTVSVVIEALEPADAGPAGPGEAAQNADAPAEHAGEPAARAAAPAPVAVARAFNPALAVDHELVRAAMEAFEARVVDVQPRRT